MKEAPRNHELQGGERASVSITVRAEHLASAHAEVEGEAYPDVLSTPSVIGLLERACAALLKPLLGNGEMSVGVRVDVAHSAPSPLGTQVTASAEFLRREGRLYFFTVTASDLAGTVVTGEHVRAIVQRSKVEQIARERKLN